MIDSDIPLIKFIFGVFNFMFLYKLLKKFKQFRFVISITRTQSRMTGYFCKLYVPRCLRRPYYGLFSMVYGVKIEEAERDRYEDYVNFTDFFTRTLKPDARVIEEKDNINSISSPCDGRILTIGKVNASDSTIDCVKGRSYRLDEFLLGYIGDSKDKTDPTVKIENQMNNSAVTALLDSVQKKGNELHYMVIYLSPGDYHRFHSPAIHLGHYRRHIAGYLSPVKPSYVEKHRDVFKNNERVNIFGEWRGDEHDFFFTSFVGALNVGSILLDFDEDVVTNVSNPQAPYHFNKKYLDASNNPLSIYEFPEHMEAAHSSDNSSSLKFEKGQMTGRFEMGSTIVLIYETPASDVQTHVEEGQKITLGQKLVSTPERTN